MALAKKWLRLVGMAQHDLGEEFKINVNLTAQEAKD